MYHLNYFPNAKHTFRVQLEPSGKFWQLLDNSGGVIAESNSWRELKAYAEKKRLTVQMYR